MSFFPLHSVDTGNTQFPTEINNVMRIQRLYKIGVENLNSTFFILGLLIKALEDSLQEEIVFLSRACGLVVECSPSMLEALG